jgi:hypothetical protein
MKSMKTYPETMPMNESVHYWTALYLPGIVGQEVGGQTGVGHCGHGGIDGIVGQGEGQLAGGHAGISGRVGQGDGQLIGLGQGCGGRGVGHTTEGGWGQGGQTVGGCIGHWTDGHGWGWGWGWGYVGFGISGQVTGLVGFVGFVGLIGQVTPGFVGTVGHPLGPLGQTIWGGCGWGQRMGPGPGREMTGHGAWVIGWGFHGAGFGEGWGGCMTGHW